MVNFDFFKEYNEKLNISQQKELYLYYELIHEYNKVMNLTGIDDLEGVYLKHFYDSLTIVEIINDIKPKNIADVGTGAGFPGIVLAIYYPDIQFTLIEPLTKRINFLNVVVERLGLKNVEVLNKRAEDIEEKFDMIVSRAVARLNILSELCLPLLNNNGYFIALKGPKIFEELNESQNALKILNSKLIETKKVILPIENSSRYNVLIKKTKEISSKYPRNFSQIKKNPL